MNKTHDFIFPMGIQSISRHNPIRLPQPDPTAPMVIHVRVTMPYPMTHEEALRALSKQLERGE